MKAYIKESQKGYFNVGLIIGDCKIHLRKFNRNHKDDAYNYFQEKNKMVEKINKEVEG